MIPIDQEAMTLIRSNRKKGSLTIVQLAYLYTILAMTGRLAPSMDRAASTMSLSWSNKRIKYIQHACVLLDHLEACCQRKRQPSGTTASQLLKVQAGLLLARYFLLQKEKDREAYGRLQKCLIDAEQMGYFEEPTKPISIHEEYIRAELYIHDKWYMLIKGKPARLGSPSECSIRWASFTNDLDSLCMKQKVEAFFLAAKITKLLLSNDKKEHWLFKAKTADSETVDYIAKLELQSSRSTLPFYGVDTTTTELASFKQQYLCTSRILFFRLMRLQLLAQAQGAMQDKPREYVIFIKRLEIANDVLRQMPQVCVDFI